MGWASPGSRQVKILVPLAILIVGLLAFVGTHTSGIAAHASAAEAAEVRAAERQARALSERASFQDHERNRSLEQRSRRELLRAQIREALHRTETSTAALRAELNVSLTELNDALHERTRLMQRLRRQRAEQEALQYDLNDSMAHAGALEGRLNSSTHASSHQRRTASWRLRSQLAPLAETLGGLTGNDVTLSEVPRGIIEEQPLHGGWVRFRRVLPGGGAVGRLGGVDGSGAGAASNLVRIPLHESLGAHVRARMSGPALVVGSVGPADGLVHAPPTLRGVGPGKLLPTSTRMATFDLGLPGLYMLEVVTLYRKPLVLALSGDFNKSECVARQSPEEAAIATAYVGMLYVEAGRAGWTGWGAKHADVPRYLLTRAQVCVKPPVISSRTTGEPLRTPDPRDQLKFYHAVIAKVSGVTLETPEYGDRSGFEAYRWGRTVLDPGDGYVWGGPTSDAAFPPLTLAAAEALKATSGDGAGTGGTGGAGSSVHFMHADAPIVPREDLCMVGDSMALMICKLIDGCRWIRANEATHRKALAPKPPSCRTLVFTFGQHDLGWPNGFPTSPEAFKKALLRLLAVPSTPRNANEPGGAGGQTTKYYVLSMNYIPLNCIITTCPPMDWRTPPAVDAYNAVAQAAVAEHNQNRRTDAPPALYVDMSDVVGPMWDAAIDWCHPRGAPARVIASRVSHLDVGNGQGGRVVTDSTGHLTSRAVMHAAASRAQRVPRSIRTQPVKAVRAATAPKVTLPPPEATSPPPIAKADPRHGKPACCTSDSPDGQGRNPALCMRFAGQGACGGDAQRQAAAKKQCPAACGGCTICAGHPLYESYTKGELYRVRQASARRAGKKVERKNEPY